MWGRPIAAATGQPAFDGQFFRQVYTLLQLEYDVASLDVAYLSIMLIISIENYDKSHISSRGVHHIVPQLPGAWLRRHWYRAFAQFNDPVGN